MYRPPPMMIRNRGGSSAPFMIIALIVVVLLLGGGYYAYTNKQKQDKEKSEKEAAAADTPAPSPSSSTKPPPPTPVPSYPPQTAEIVPSPLPSNPAPTIKTEVASTTPPQTFSETTSSSYNKAKDFTNGYFPVRSYMVPFDDADDIKTVEECQEACEDLGCVGWEWNVNKCSYNDIRQQPNDEFNVTWSGINIIQPGKPPRPSIMMQGNLVDWDVNSMFMGYDKKAPFKTNDAGTCQTNCINVYKSCNVWTWDKTTKDCTYYKSNSSSFVNKLAQYGISNSQSKGDLALVNKNYHTVKLGELCNDTYSCGDNLSCRTISKDSDDTYCVQSAGTVKNPDQCFDTSECITGLTCTKKGSDVFGTCLLSNLADEGGKCYGDPFNCKYNNEVFSCAPNNTCVLKPHVLTPYHHMLQTESLNFKGVNGSTSNLFFNSNATLQFTSSLKNNVPDVNFVIGVVHIPNASTAPQKFRLFMWGNGDLCCYIYNDLNDWKTAVPLWKLGPKGYPNENLNPLRYEISDIGLSLKGNDGRVIFTYNDSASKDKYTLDVYCTPGLRAYYDTSIVLQAGDITKTFTVGAGEGLPKLSEVMHGTGGICGFVAGTQLTVLYKRVGVTKTDATTKGTMAIIRDPTELKNVAKWGVCMVDANCGETGLACVTPNVNNRYNLCLTKADCTWAADQNKTTPESACYIQTGQAGCNVDYDCQSGKCSIATKTCIDASKNCVNDSDCTGALKVCGPAGACIGRPLGGDCTTDGSILCDGAGNNCAGGSKKCVVAGTCFDRQDCYANQNDFTWCNASKACVKVPLGQACIQNSHCDTGKCAVSTKMCIAAAGCETSDDCSGSTNWCDSADKTCKAPMDVYGGGEMHMNGQHITCLISQNGKWALRLRSNADLVVYARDERTGAIDENTYKWHSWSYTQNTPDMSKARLRFDAGLGGLNVDYFNTTRNSWIQIFEQISSGINHYDATLGAYRPVGPYYLQLTNDGDLNICDKFGSIHWSSTGTSYYGKSFHALRQMGYVQGNSATGWTDFPNTADYAASIGQLMTTVNANASAIGFTVDYRDNGWKYKVLVTDGDIFPNTTGHTYMKNLKNNKSRVNYFEYDGGAFSFTNGRNLDASTIEFSYQSEAEKCAQKSILNGASRGFVYNPNNGDCWTAGDTEVKGFAGLNYYPMPTAGAPGYQSGWKTGQAVKNVVYSDSFFSQIKSNNGQFFFTCNDNGEVRLTRANGELIWSNHVYCWQGCKLQLQSGWGGRLVMFDKDNVERWLTNDDNGTDVQSRFLEIGDDGVVRLKNAADGAIIWDTQNWPTNRIEFNTTIPGQVGNQFSAMRNGNYVLWVANNGSVVVSTADRKTNIWWSPATSQFDYFRCFLNGEQFGVELLNGVHTWECLRDFSYYPAGVRTLYLFPDGALRMYHDSALTWSSRDWAPRNLHVSRGKATGSKWFRIQAVFLSGTTVMSQQNQCLGVPGTPADHAAVYFYSDTQPLTDQANWKLYPVLDDAGSNGEYYIVLASNTNYHLHRWDNSDSDVCLRLRSADMNNNSRWRITWDGDLNDKTCRIRPRDNLSKALYWTNSNVNGSRAYVGSGAAATSAILNLSW